MSVVHIVRVGYIDPPVTRQRQALTVARSAHFIVITVSCLAFPAIQRFCGFFRIPVHKFAGCSKPPSRDNHRKASYPRTQQCDQSTNWT